jgi:2-polyprenyl-3-methyl-5-hydroxy-6-metoxy-1,4-benzoquinol methylase
MRKGMVRKMAEIWDKEANSYCASADTSPDYLAHYSVVESALGPVRGKKICDLGSGTGITSGYLASKGAAVHLVDISKKALEFQRNYFKSKRLTARYYCQDIFNLKLPPEQFDGVWNGGVIEHFPDNEKVEMLKIMWRLLKPGGTLLVSAPSAEDWPFMLAKKILEWRKKWAFGFEDDLTANRMKTLAIKAGIKNFSVYAYNPVVGWWFFPYGREITTRLGLNNPARHKAKGAWGHNLVLTAKKPHRE